MFNKYGKGCLSWCWQHIIVSACGVVVGSIHALSATWVLSPKSLPDSGSAWHTQDACIYSFRRKHTICKPLEDTGIEPMTSRMQSERSTNWATPPKHAPAGNRTRGPTMATLDFTTKPLAHALAVSPECVSRPIFCIWSPDLVVGVTIWGCDLGLSMLLLLKYCTCLPSFALFAEGKLSIARGRGGYFR